MRLIIVLFITLALGGCYSVPTRKCDPGEDRVWIKSDLGWVFPICRSRRKQHESVEKLH